MSLQTPAEAWLCDGFTSAISCSAPWGSLSWAEAHSGGLSPVPLLKGGRQYCQGFPLLPVSLSRGCPAHGHWGVECLARPAGRVGVESLRAEQGWARGSRPHHGSMALSVGVRRLSQLPGHGQRQVHLSFRGGLRVSGTVGVWGFRAGGCLLLPAPYTSSLLLKASLRRRGRSAVVQRLSSRR